jgi:16S rRNA (guanine(966)-N(2))-methyltransferase RsmD
MENRRPSPPHKGSGPRRSNGPKGRSGPGGGWYGDRERSGGTGRPASGGSRYGKGQDGQRDGYRSGPGGRFRSGKPGDRNRKPGGKPPWDHKPSVKITSDLQITDGKFRGKLLHNSASPNMTPTRHRLREMLFKLVSPRRVRGGRFLDICAGSGLVGLEAISRGAMLSTFVDRSARMCSWTKKNAAELGIKDGHAEIIESEVLPFLKQMARRRRRWDIVFFCVPTDGTGEELLKYLGRGITISTDGSLIVQHPSEMELPDALGVLHRVRTHKMDGTTLSFYDRK